MKILFVSSGNFSESGVSPIIKAQAESLRELGIQIEIFAIVGKGVSGYLSSTYKLRKFLIANQFDLIHAHYTFAGLVAVIGGRKTPVLLSLMGSDACGEKGKRGNVRLLGLFKIILSQIIQLFVVFVISKSANIDRYVYRKQRSAIIPNGVDMKMFRQDERNLRSGLGLSSYKKYILFLGDPKDPNKNFDLLQKACSLINDPGIEILCPYPIPHEDVPKYLNVADIFVLLSFSEGSPNVVKEAMACNCPIVATRVGDVCDVLGETQGCFLTSFNAEETSRKIREALKFAIQKGRTKGRERLLKLSLDSDSIARRISHIYSIIIADFKYAKKKTSQNRFY